MEMLTAVAALTAYDCQHPNTTYQVVNSLAPAACPDPELDYEEPRPQMLQLLQIDTKVPVKAHKCQVTVSKKVTRCGFNSLTYGSLWPVWLKDYALTPEECRKAVDQQAIAVEGRTYKAEVGIPQQYRFFSKGSLSPNMDCTYVAGFESGGQWFRWSTEETLVEISLSIVRGVSDTATGEVIFANGLRANYRDLVLRDALEGTMVWTHVEAGCEETASEVFHGKGDLHRRIGANGLGGSIVLLRHSSTSQFAGLVLKAIMNTCGARCFTTQVRGLIVCPYRDGDLPLPKAMFKAHFEPSRVDLQTQLGYLHVTTNMATARRFAQVQAELCQLERRTLFHKLQAIAGSDNVYALLDLYGPGHQVHQAELLSM